MEIKDVILLIIQIFIDGMLLYIFQKWLGKKMERRQGLRDDVLRNFWNKLQKLNDIFVQFSIEIEKLKVVGQDTSKFIQEYMITIQEYILELVKYYDTNNYDLTQFKITYNEFLRKWQEFLEYYNRYCNIELDDRIRFSIGNKMQLVKDTNQKLINEIRDKY